MIPALLSVTYIELFLVLNSFLKKMCNKCCMNCRPYLWHKNVDTYTLQVIKVYLKNEI